MAKRLPGVVATALLASLGIIVSITWYYAYQHGNLPPSNFDNSMGGPWNHNAEMTKFVDVICGVGSLGVVASLVWLATARTTRSRLVAIGLIVLCVATIVYHVMLID